MPASIGVNLRVTGHCRQGGRKYMEDFFSVAYQQTEDEKDLEYAFFGIYDGHGGAEAAAFAKEHLMETIIKHKNFWSDYDEDVLRAIKDGYIATHYAMWKEQEKWPRTASGLPSTAGTTASVAFIRRGKIYIGHVGDSGIILGYQEPGSSEWRAKPLTRDHKPENADEMSRIEQCGGKVVAKSGVPRVVWNRPKIGHKGPVRRSTPIDEIPFLAVARSLGDLWSYNSQINQFIVSPDPDCSVLKIDTNMHRCLIFGTDGLYNMLSPMMAVHIVQQAERHNENAALSDSTYKTWLNPSKLLVEKALERWHATKMRADNTSVVTLMLDPPGPPRAQVLKDRKKNLPERGLKIMTRFDGNNSQESSGNNCDNSMNLESPSETSAQRVVESVPEPTPAVPTLSEEHPNNKGKEDDGHDCTTSMTESTPVSSSDLTSNFPLKERNFVQKTRESTSFDPRDPSGRPSVSPDNGKENLKASPSTDDNIQCNEISSSNLEVDNTCEDQGEVDSTNKITKHNLRSSNKAKIEVPVKLKPSGRSDCATITKRKLNLDESAPQPRKSLRIDHIQKKAVVVDEKERKAFEAEENLKRLAEKADLAKRSSRSLPAKLSLAQKIMKSKNINLKKKKSLVKKQITKKKLQMVLQSVKRSTLASKPSMTKQKEQLEKVRDHKQISHEKKVNRPQVKVTAAKTSGFKRNSKKNSSQRQRNVTVLANKLSGNKVKTKKPSDTKDNKQIARTKNVTTVSKVKVTTPKKYMSIKVSSSNVPAGGDSRRSLRSSTSSLVAVKASLKKTTVYIEEAPVSSTAKNPKSTNKAPKAKVTGRAKTLRKRIQQKTESIRRNVMRSKNK